MIIRKLFGFKENVLKYLTNTSHRFQIPEKWKGGRIEKWSLFWQGLFLDYKSVAMDTIQESRAKPKVAIMISSGLCVIFAAIKMNPNEQSFNDHQIKCITELAMVGDPIRNPTAENHIQNLTRSRNQGLLRRTDLLFLTLIWEADYNKGCNIYSSQCKYLQPQFLTFHRRIMDVGIFGTWLNLKLKMQDFDVNPNEWNDNS